MRDWSIILIIALMIVMGIFVKITQIQIDLIDDRLNKIHERLTTVERNLHIYGIN